MEEAEAPESPPALASLSQVEQTPDEPAPRSFDPAQDRPLDPAQRRRDLSRVTGLEDFLKAILRARAQRDASR